MIAGDHLRYATRSRHGAQVETGGPSQALHNLFMYLKDLTDWLSGNLIAEAHATKSS